MDREKADLLVVIGTSLKVSPVAEILSECTRTSYARHLIDKEQLIRSSSAFNPTSECSQLDEYLELISNQILINKTPIRHINPDVRCELVLHHSPRRLMFALRPQIILLGNADDIIVYLCGELGWELPPPHGKTPLLNITEHSRPLQDRVKKRPFTPLHDIAPPNRVRNRSVSLLPSY